MKRLVKSSNFWNAIISSIVLILASKMGVDITVIYIIGGLFGARSIATGIQDAKNPKIKDDAGLPASRIFPSSGGVRR